MELQVEGLLVVRPEMMVPQVLQPAGQDQAGFEFAVLPLVAHPVDEQLTGPRIVAFVGLEGPGAAR